VNYYVWYRVERDEPDTEILVRAMMARVGCRAGVAGRLLKKRDEPRLWMEVYENVADSLDFERLLAQKADEFDVGMFIDGARRVECFLDGAAVAPSCGLPA
jgi:hypothetical protein